MEKSLETVPGLDLSGEDIEMYYQYVRFVDRFLRFNRNYQIEYFKLSYPGDGSSEREVDLLKRWIDTVIQLKVKDLDFFDYSWEWGFDNFQLPSTIYICESLVSLKLSTVTLPSVKSVSLPFLRVLKLGAVKFADHLDLETLISGCTALETLAIRFFDRVQVLQVSSQSLLSFTHVAPKLVFTHAVRKPLAEKDLSIVIDAPRLEYLKLSDHQTASFIIKNPGSLVAVDIDINLSSGFDSRNMIRDFLVGISSVKNRTISSITLKKSTEELGIKESSMFSGPQDFLPSLEYVEMKMPLKKGLLLEIRMLVGYFLEKATILKKLTLCLDDYRKRKESLIPRILAIPRISTSCEVVVL
ncbi:FBD domain [Arabidopsis thaliana x Arabidopsis arenosa]|uniref:FBD domain n=1 Tax=Arabidopsis thaliana x Arabidopsis arenosa TaxID=1240361 RepID=A0A8T2GWY2_9BRAS|nr:FBD domain [Arabidopsis thaliana x Arabidopsis arenosa]